LNGQSEDVEFKVRKKFRLFLPNSAHLKKRSPYLFCNLLIAKPITTGTHLEPLFLVFLITSSLNRNCMHNIDLTTNEFEFENEFELEGEGEFEFEFEGEGEGEFEFEGEMEGEALEMELTTELLEVNNEQELEQFLGNLFSSVAKGVSNFAKSGIGKTLIGGLKSIAKKALPIAGGALGNFLVPGLGGAIGSKLGGMASNLFELELEGLSNEDREFEVARRFVQFASDAARKAASAASSGAPAKAIVNAALKQAAYNYAPGLLKVREGGGNSGTWERRGPYIVVLGV
jgi:uncharacterized protein (DUF697 family)